MKKIIEILDVLKDKLNIESKVSYDEFLSYTDNLQEVLIALETAITQHDHVQRSIIKKLNSIMKMQQGQQEGTQTNPTDEAFQ